jgi:predicted Fe-Mo cluster-binding NifX family protein
MEFADTLKQTRGLSELQKSKICFPVKKNPEIDDYEIVEDLNSASYYCIVNLDEKTKSFIDLKQISEAFQSGEKGFEKLGFSTLICKKVSQMPLKILYDAGISVVIPEGKSIDMNCELFKNNALSDFNAATDYKSSCSGSCSSCSSTSCN